MIYMMFGGGLGNQLFQYAFLYSQIKENNPEINQIYAIMHHNKIEDSRNFLLKNFKTTIDMKLINENSANKYLKNKLKQKNFIIRIQNKLHLSNSSTIKLLKLFNIISVNDIYKYYNELRINKRLCFVEGAFQSWKYSIKYKEDLRKEFTLRDSVSKKTQSVIDDVRKSNSVCVHIRRGDYLNSQYANTLNICDYQYYKESIDTIKQRIKDPIFYVFSNNHSEINWIKTNYKFDANISYVDLDNNEIEDFEIMKNCKHFIISNSTFSWWAQYLSTNTNKIVVAPSLWIKSNVHNFNDIYMDDWKIINVK